jgi:hypothetical protein
LAPAVGVTFLIVEARPGVMRGPRCDGPDGVFVPPPPGSRHGLIVPAPMGTAPAVVVGSPPAIHRGMHIRGDDEGHVRIEAPAGVTANGRPLTMTAPRMAHLAAAQQPVVRAAAPAPASAAPIRTYSPRQGFSRLPEARQVRPVIAQPALVHRAPPGAGSPGGQRLEAVPRQEPAQRPAQMLPQAPPQRPEVYPRQQPAPRPDLLPTQRQQPDERRDSHQQRLEPAQRAQPPQQYAPPPRVAVPQPNTEAPRMRQPAVPQVERPVAPPAVAPRPVQPPPPPAPAKPQVRNEREDKEKEKRP